MTKKSLGIFFLVVSTLLAIAAFLQMKAFLIIPFQFIALFSGNLDASQAGQISGNILYWFAHLTLTIVLWKYGKKWTRKSASASQDDQR